MKMVWRKPALVLLFITVLAPIVLVTDRLSNSISVRGFADEVSDLGFGNEAGKAHEVTENVVKEPIGIVYSDNSRSRHQISDESSYRAAALTGKESPLQGSGDHKSRVLSATDEGARVEKEGVIHQVTGKGNEQHSRTGRKVKLGSLQTTDASLSDKQDNKREKQSQQTTAKVDQAEDQTSTATDATVRHLRDQLIRAKVYQSLRATRSNPRFIRELKRTIKDVERALRGATKDSELPKNAYEKLNAMEQTLAKGKQIEDDCAAVVGKLRAMIHSSEDRQSIHKKENMFLTQLVAKTLPKGLHCLPLRLSADYYSLDPSQQQFPNQEKLEDTKHYHYALFSDNVLAAAVVVNSTVLNAKHPANHVFHIVTDRLNYAAMRMWFLANPPGKAAIEVQNLEEYMWLNTSYCPVLAQLRSESMIDYYFRTHHSNPDGNTKFRNPKYLSILNHLRFYLPEIFPKLDKVVFLDDDIVVQKDLSGLWGINLKGKVNGAVETCRESFHRFDKYLNFSNPLIAKTFDRRACGWAYGMNVFDLAEWRNQNLTEVYHSWQKLNHDRSLWNLGTLPPGLITFWNFTLPIDRSWHALGLGYDPELNQKDIERAAVIHYNGNKKPWLDIGISKYRSYWSKYVHYDQVYLRNCNINP